MYLNFIRSGSSWTNSSKLRVAVSVYLLMVFHIPILHEACEFSALLLWSLQSYRMGYSICTSHHDRLLVSQRVHPILFKLHWVDDEKRRIVVGCSVVSTRTKMLECVFTNICDYRVSSLRTTVCQNIQHILSPLRVLCHNGSFSFVT